jgi:LysM repeat protein/ABC-type branched-subunit amino acid transport system substrate-binding protein
MCIRDRQEKKAETPVVAENEGFRVHTVVSGETLYSISKKYEVSVGEILLHNPDANQLKAGSRLMIPAKKDEVREDVSESTDNFIVHTIVSGESIYGITKKYKVTEAELLALNPSLKTGFQTGKQIRIPVKSGWTDVSAPGPEISGVKSISLSPALIMSADAPENCRPAVQPGRNETINVALFLPLFLEANKTLNQDFLKEENDSIEEPMVMDTVALDTLPDDSDLIEEELPMILLKQFHDKSENFLQFYEGVLLAVDSMQKAGMKIKLNVFDTRDNPAAVRNIVNSAEFKTTDLIIGPVYENVQNEVVRVATAHDIPMVSPFVSKSNLINGNPLFFQVNPSRDYLIEASSDMVNVKDTNLNFVVLQTSPYGGTPEGNLVDLIQRKIQFSDSQHKPAFTVYDFKTRRAQGFPELLKKDKENIVIIPTTDEGELSVAISNLNNTTDSISITLLGTSNYQQRYPSIELSHFHNLKLKYINPYWVNYEDSTTIRFYHKFISVFGTEPSGFGIQGFDVAYYFLNAMHYFGEDFTNCLPYFTINLLQGKYYFEKVSSWGGWMNKGVSVLKYQTDFEVKQERIMGLPFDFEKTAVQAKKEPSPFY